MEERIGSKMKNGWKKITALILALLMMLNISPLSAVAGEVDVQGNAPPASSSGVLVEEYDLKGTLTGAAVSGTGASGGAGSAWTVSAETPFQIKLSFGGNEFPELAETELVYRLPEALQMDAAGGVSVSSPALSDAGSGNGVIRLKLGDGQDMPGSFDVTFTASMSAADDPVSLDFSDSVNYIITFVPGTLTITDATDPLFNLTELYVYDNGRNQWASKGWYRLKKQEEGILTNKPLEKWVEGLGKEKERPSDRDKPDTLEKDKDYSFIAEYDFAGFTFKYDGKTYSYYDENSGAVPPTGNYYTVSNKVRVVAAHLKIGGMVDKKARWLNEATDYFEDNNAIDCFKRNFKIYLHDVSGQTLYNFLNVDRNNKYYRLKTGEIITKDIKEFKVNEDIPSSMYTLNPEGEYNFSNVALKLDGITYVYSQTPLTGELDAWYSIDYSKTRVRRLDRIHEDPTWFKEESGWLDVRKEEYPTDTNGVIAFHRDYFATLHDPQYIGVKLVANNGTYTYDGKLKTVSGYEVYQGEKKLTNVTFSGVTAIAQETDAGDYTVDFTGYVLNETKADNGKKYIITEVVPGKLTIDPKAVTITAQDKKFTYNGTAQSWPEYDVDGLVGDDAISAVVTGSITFPRESPVTNVLTSYEFTKGTSGNYKVTTANGSLTMKKASVAITIKAADDEWTYDGLPHSNTAVTVSEGSLLTGDTLVATATGSVRNVSDTAAGNNPIAAGYKIMHGTEDVTANYAITTVAGKLTILPKAVTVTAKSEEFTYDGTAHSNAGYDVAGLVGDDVISAVVTGSITFPSESPVTNVVTSYKFTTGTPGNYTVTTANGELTMTTASQAITITAASEEWTYDGAGHQNTGVTLTAGALLEGDRLDATASGSVRNVADTADGNNPVAKGYRIMHGDTDVTANYTITTVAGKLTILPKAVTVTAENKTKVYDNDPKTDPELTAVVDGVLEGETVSYQLSRTGAQEVGTYPITPTGDVNQGNYEVTYAPGTFTITPAPEPQKYTLTIRYWADGQTAAPDFRGTYTAGASYSVTSPVKAGYQVDRSLVSGTITEDTVIDVYYTRNDVTLTVRYLDLNGNRLADEVVRTLKSGDAYRIESPAVERYTALTGVVEGTMPGTNKEVIVYYVREEETEDDRKVSNLTIDEYLTPMGIGNVNRGFGEAIE